MTMIALSLQTTLTALGSKADAASGTKYPLTGKFGATAATLRFVEVINSFARYIICKGK